MLSRYILNINRRSQYSIKKTIFFKLGALSSNLKRTLVNKALASYLGERQIAASINIAAISAKGNP